MIMLTSKNNIRYTTVLPAKYVEELKELAAQKVIASVNNGIREALEHFLQETRRELYAQKLAEAAQDKNYLKRTMETQSDFSNVDEEVGGQW